MKKIITILLIAITACNQPQPAPTTIKNVVVPAKDSIINNLAQLNFASKKDLSCGMPISAGVSDTATYKGKLYGFCSAECKADFLKNTEALLKAK